MAYFDTSIYRAHRVLLLSVFHSNKGRSIFVESRAITRKSISGQHAVHSVLPVGPQGLSVPRVPQALRHGGREVQLQCKDRDHQGLPKEGFCWRWELGIGQKLWFPFVSKKCQRRTSTTSSSVSLSPSLFLPQRQV